MEKQIESRYSKKLAYRKSRLGIIDFKDKQTEFQQAVTAIPLPLMVGYVGIKRGPGFKQQQVYSPLPCESFQVVIKFSKRNL